MTALAALVFCTVLGGLALFQVALIAGRPLGRFAWGGQHDVLPTRLRVGSAISLALYAVFALVVLEKADILSIAPLEGVTDVAAWVVAAYLLVGVGLNLISRSKPERYTMTPVALVLALSAVVVAAS